MQTTTKGEESMLRKIMVFGLFVASMIVLAASDARAVWINGRWVSKGVLCEGEATVKNIDNNPVSIACSAEITQPADPQEPNVIITCQNPGGNISSGTAFVDNATLDVGLFVPYDVDKKGKTTFIAILGSGSLAPQSDLCEEGDIYCNCDNDPTGFCQTLRLSCPNNNWAPIDLVPIRMTATAATYFCDNDGFHLCPCDPTISDTAYKSACASATGRAQDPWTFNWADTGGMLVPWAREVSDCTLPNPETWQYGDRRPYDCTVIIDEGK
jgi:hypothetical protein